jgi:hypothetical protein
MAEDPRAEDSENVVITFLPTFSTERFYLLSELEQISDGQMHGIYSSPDEDPSPGQEQVNEVTPSKSFTEAYWTKLRNNLKKQKNETEGKEKDDIFLIYLLWNESNGVEKLMENFETTLGGFEYNERYGKAIKRVIAVEIMLNEKGSWTKEQEKFFIQTLRQLSAKYASLQFIFGIADNFASPALEALLTVATEFQKQSQSCQIITSSEANFLGHNIRAEPDAISGVFQVLLILNGTKNESEDLKMPSHNALEIERTQPKFDLIRSQGALFLLVAALSWFVYAYCNNQQMSL